MTAEHAFRCRRQASATCLADVVCYGSGGGTGFDLSRSGFSTIQYVKVEGIPPAWSGGEIDAFSAVRPLLLGEHLSISPENIASEFRTIYFQEPGNTSVTAVSVDFRGLTDLASVRAQRLDPATLTGVNSLVEAIDLQIEQSRPGRVFTTQVDARISLADKYEGAGGDLVALTWDGARWNPATFFAFDRDSSVATVSSITNSTRIAITRMTTPVLTFARKAEGIEISFAWTEGWTHTLERTTDFAQWIEIDSAQPIHGRVTAFTDANPPASQAFYRLRLTRP